MISDRSLFLAALSAVPSSQGDAIVCLAGEEGDTRAHVAAHLFKQGHAPGIVVTGGRHEPPTHIGAQLLTSLILGAGIAPDRIVTDKSSRNTREQAISVVVMAKEKGWKRLLLVVSAYHAPRAYLTFLRALQEQKADDVYLVPVPVKGADRFVERLTVELGKVEGYAEIGHVASYADGLAYLQRWSVP